ncbi:hypothetical protein COCC4DRAFT_155642 [Bipolaris maydis ATCC 48331]|uniref:Uncharacterized protein n=1 Tax=Cochliobolus heterostrophus (strain C4 / ATCC 48331 / race T) TaxID=665024 RepID=N4WZT0_COCH4|nr:uncharacterized protein COCC4DRAFT_155642 [Bipolaris maydis ATCC 48331]ENH98491.1 hypothetical protein COCC4DRAFT_155642 [Bipolaris maydis ATCC 48331]
MKSTHRAALIRRLPHEPTAPVAAAAPPQTPSLPFPPSFLFCLLRKKNDDHDAFCKPGWVGGSASTKVAQSPDRQRVNPTLLPTDLSLHSYAKPPTDSMHTRRMYERVERRVSMGVVGVWTRASVIATGGVIQDESNSVKKCGYVVSPFV